MTDSAISFQGTISERLFLRAQKLHIGRGRLLLPLLFGAVILGIWIMPELPFLAKVLGTIGYVAVLALLPVIQRRQLKRLYNRSPYLLVPIRGELSEWGLRSEGSMGKSEIPWSKFVKYKINDRTVLLYQAPNLFHVIAEEFFATTDDWIRVRRLIVDRSGVKIG
jgi:hypothetical protein